ncbi:hypothetical protein BC834DRAFT_82194 [Gloeopeniophorella convolvens]|nr:hypothetical protein BC834DRAFT_82194 [Gloeopeniophorella convolvens]
MVIVIFCTTATFVPNVQLYLTAAAKEGGVELFVPSEFAGPANKANGGFFATRGELQSRLKATSPPWPFSILGSDRTLSGIRSLDPSS